MSQHPVLFLNGPEKPLPTSALPLELTSGIRVRVLRLDQLDPLISGNKWFKLRYYLQEALEKKLPVLSFGGAWSNHILATAVACQRLRILCTGLIRGEEPGVYSDTLQQARETGMRLIFVSRSDYARKNIPAELRDQEHLVIPEGGYGKKGVAGAATILDQAPGDFTHCFCAVGTGTMLAGLINRCGKQQTITGVPVLKNAELPETIGRLLSDPTANYRLLTGYEFGGYAKYNQELLDFMNDFYRSTGIPTDFVYTGKLFYALWQQLRHGLIPKDAEVLVIHSGGLQGNRGLPKDSLMF